MPFLKLFFLNRNQQGGFVLALSLAAIAILMIVSGTFIYAVRAHRASFLQFRAHLLHQQLAKNGVLWTIAKIQADTNAFDDPTELIFQDDVISYPTHKITNLISISDCGSLLNVNTTPLDLLARIPNMPESILLLIQNKREQGILIRHLCELDPHYHRQPWASALTVFGPMNVNTSDAAGIRTVLLSQGLSSSEAASIEKTLAQLRSPNNAGITHALQAQNIEDAFLNNPRQPRIVSLLNTEPTVNVNTMPDPLLTLYLQTLHFSSTDISSILSYRAQQPFQRETLQQTDDSIFAPYLREAIAAYLSFQTTFYKIQSKLVRDGDTSPFMTTEAIVEKTSPSSVRVIYWLEL